MADERKNEFGDPEGTMYAGGTPEFDERTGQYRRRPGAKVALASLRPASYKLGYGTYGMPELAAIDAVTAVHECGYDGVELCCLPNQPGHPSRIDEAARRELRQRLDDLGVELPALMLGLNGLADDPEPEREALRQAIALGYALSPGSPPVMVTTTGGSPSKWATHRDQLVESLYEWAAICSREKVYLAIEPHVGGILHTPEQADWIRRRIDLPALKFNYDESHFQLRSLPLAESVRLMAPYAVATHVKDAEGDAEHVKFLLPGDGNFDYPAFIELLHDAGYRGYLTVEVSGMVWKAAGYDAVAEAKRCHDFLDHALVKAAERLAAR